MDYVMGFHPASFGLPRPFRSRVRSRHLTDRRTDRHRPSFYNAPPYGGRSYNSVKCVHDELLILNDIFHIKQLDYFMRS